MDGLEPGGIGGGGGLKEEAPIRDRLRVLLAPLYGAAAPGLAAEIASLVERRRAALDPALLAAGARARQPLGQAEVMLIAYGDSIREAGRPPLAVLRDFLDARARGVLTALHLLPMYPSTSDDGFSVVDYRTIDPRLGGWAEVEALAAGYDLMFDAVINHVSRSSPWFRAFLSADPAYRNYFIQARPGADYSRVVRPRALPLFTEVETARGRASVWTTFSEDQIDLNFAEPRVLLEVLDVLLDYSSRGARFIRLDAVGFIWKEEGRGCLNLPGAHALVKVARLSLDALGLGTRIITETNVPHDENVAYFGSGDEAQLVYQFPLPPLVLFSFLAGNVEKLSAWARGLEADRLPPDCAWFNFLASHDGIGLRPTEGILDDGERALLVERTLERGGRVGWRSGSGGEPEPYELNISFIDALCAPEAGDEERAATFLASQAILLALDGLPGIYVHSLLGSRNWKEGMEGSGINRRINREKLELGALLRELDEPGSLRALIFGGLSLLIRIRAGLPAFAPGSRQLVLDLGPRLFALERGGGKDRVLALVNVVGEAFSLDSPRGGRDLISGESFSAGPLPMGPYQVRWIVPEAGSQHEPSGQVGRRLPS